MKDYLHLRNPFRSFCTLMFFICVFIGMPPAQAFGQDLSKRIDLTCQNEPMPSVLKKVEKVSGFKVLFTYNEVQRFKVTVNLQKKTVNEIINAIVAPFPLRYKIEGKYISISAQAGKENRQITGKVKDSNGDPLPGDRKSVV